MVSQILAIATAAILLLPFYLLIGRPLELNSILAGYGPIAKIPLWQQGLIVIFIGDFIGYWTHRINHRMPVLWGYHAVHHSAETLDWLSAVRVHPFNDMFSKGLKAVPIMLLGFSPLAADLYSPILSSYIAFIHANVPWHYGPFRHILASPAFHRWHHEMDRRAWGKNYAGLFPIFDVIFGTFYLPLDKQPREFGIDGETMTENFIGQMLYPIHYWKTLWQNHKANKQLLEKES
nr:MULTISPECIES: sterol desaturase family protein [unclassified Leptolyngbya]